MPQTPTSATSAIRTLGWFGVFRLGLVQTALGAIVVLTTSTINRVMVVELALPALLPGLLVGLHYAVQVTRPHMGHGSDRGGRRTPWIVGGMAVLAAGGTLAAFATALAASSPGIGIALAFVAFVMVGLGVGCAGTSLLVLLAKSVAPRWRGVAATTVWVMMIIGFIVTSIVAGANLDPFSWERLVGVTATVSVIAFAVTCVAVHGVERRVFGGAAPVATASGTRGVADRRVGLAIGDGMASGVADARGTAGARTGALADARAGAAANAGYRQAIAEVWAEPEARRFSVFVFVSMLAYSAQDLILEPFAGTVFGMTPGESTQLSGAHSGGVLAGMLLVALCTSLGGRLGGRAVGRAGDPAGRGAPRTPLASLRFWTVAGCVASALALVALAGGGLVAGAGSLAFPLRAGVFALGLANGAFAVAAIGSMMDLVGRGGRGREGVRMGLWGAAQAIAFGLGGVLATSAVDLSALVAAHVSSAYAFVFALQALLFVLAARLACGVYRPAAAEAAGPLPVGRMVLETQS